MKMFDLGGANGVAPQVREALRQMREALLQLIGYSEHKGAETRKSGYSVDRDAAVCLKGETLQQGRKSLNLEAESSLLEPNYLSLFKPWHSSQLDMQVSIKLCLVYRELKSLQARKASISYSSGKQGKCFSLLVFFLLETHSHA